MKPCNMLETYRQFEGIFASVLIQKKGPAAGLPNVSGPQISFVLVCCHFAVPNSCTLRHMDTHPHAVLHVNRTAIKSRQFAFLLAVRSKDDARTAVCDVIKATKQFVQFS
jgi:hypothetical protein